MAVHIRILPAMRLETKTFTFFLAVLVQPFLAEAHVLVPRGNTCQEPAIQIKISDIIAPKQGYTCGVLTGIKVEDVGIPHSSTIYLLNRVDRLPLQLQRVVESFNAANGKYGCAGVTITGSIVRYLPHRVANVFVTRNLFDALFKVKSEDCQCQDMHPYCSSENGILWDKLASDLQSLITFELQIARDNKDSYPRAVCQYIGSNKVCASWSATSSVKIVQADVDKMASSCVNACPLNGQSCQITKHIANDRVSFCVSNRENGCGAHGIC